MSCSSQEEARCEPKHMDPVAKSSANSTHSPPPQESKKERAVKSNAANATATATHDLASAHAPVDPASKTNANSSMNPPSAKTNDAKTSYLGPNNNRGMSTSTRSDSLESSTTPLRPHTGGDIRWDAINLANSRDSPLGLSHFRLLKRLGYGDIGSVYLVELRGTTAYFAMKVMDKASLASRNKLLRAQTEKEILGLLDHPFLPTLYSYFETDKFYCLVMEFCSGGNLHSLRQKQPNKHFSEEAARLVPFHFILFITLFPFFPFGMSGSVFVLAYALYIPFDEHYDKGYPDHLGIIWNLTN